MTRYSLGSVLDEYNKLVYRAVMVGYEKLQVTIFVMVNKMLLSMRKPSMWEFWLVYTISTTI